MANKSKLSGCFNILNRNGLQWYVDKYAIPASLHPVLPEKDTPIYPFIPGKIGVYTRLFDYYNYRLPLTKLLIEVLLFHEVHLSQMNPFGLAKVCHFELACRGLGSDPDLDVFRLKDWKDRFFLIDNRCVPTSMTWRLKTSRLPPPLPEDFTFNKDLYATLIKEAGCIQKYPEHILVMGRITMSRTGVSFDSTEFDVRATRTPKGDPPYLSVVQENLYSIREPTAPIIQGGSAGQSGSAAVVGDKGKRSESFSAKGSGSKFVIYGSKHLSFEDEEVHAEEEEEGDDDGAEVQPQVSLIRRRNTSKPDPNPKILKKKKLDVHIITLDDD
ncbi:hypothetical protein Hanom_Chr08g00724231 [Helianthus anomalus]